MAVRVALPVIAAVAVAIASPVLAQDRYDPGLPPPLPELVEDELDHEIDDVREDYSNYAESGAGYDAPADLAPVGWSDPRFGYSEDQRTAWYAQCRAAYGITASAFDTCGDHLVRYEQAYVAYLDTMNPPDCCCEEDVEVIVEEVADEPAPVPRQRQPDKRIKLEPL
jgi:hypothetical protein